MANEITKTLSVSAVSGYRACKITPAALQQDWTGKGYYGPYIQEVADGVYEALAGKGDVGTIGELLIRNTHTATPLLVSVDEGSTLFATVAIGDTVKLCGVDGTAFGKIQIAGSGAAGEAEITVIEA